jgi:hypothetical protein
MSRHNSIYGASEKTNPTLSPTTIASRVKPSNANRAISQATQRSCELRGEIEHKNFERQVGTFHAHESINKTNSAHIAVFWATCFMLAIVGWVLNS